MADAVAVLLWVRDPAATAVVAGWQSALAKLGRPAELVVVDDGCSPPLELAGVRVLRQDTPQGFGACLRTGLAATDQPLVATAAADYPYSPTDLARLLAELETEHDVPPLGRVRPSLVSGMRTGRPHPLGWTAVGVTYRLLARVLCGFQAEPSGGWLGFRTHRHSWAGWLLFANRLHDPDSAFRVYRRELLDLFPIQSDGDFVHTEIEAKASFCNRLVAEVPLTPSAAAVPAADWSGWTRVFNRPAFHPVLVCG